MAQRQYRGNCRKASRTAWRKYCEEQDTMSAICRLQKSLEYDPSAKLDVLQKDDGTYTESDMETLSIMIKHHFQNSSTER